MTEGDVALTALPQADGTDKVRPVILLRKMPVYGDFLLCGVSTQLHHCIEGFDEIISSNDDDFFASGLKSASLVRTGYLSVLPRHQLLGRIGAISDTRHARLLSALVNYLRPSPHPYPPAPSPMRRRLWYTAGVR